jgi:exoribonuclease-2
MSEAAPRQDSLVLYKTRPARVLRAGRKIEIELEGGEIVSVRPKDVTLLHPGPVHSLAELQPQAGEVQTAWELLAGSTTDLSELAELAYGDDTPATAWAAWEQVAGGLYFEGTPEEIVACTSEEVTKELAAREARAASERAWAAFLKRAHAGRALPEDGPFLREVEDLALGRLDRSRVLRELGRAESPENAHALLLELGYWDQTVDPYPQRLGVATAAPEQGLPDLPDEVRVDLTHLPAFAIDDEGNQEPDDAISLDGDSLWVHVADVAALVPPGSPPDVEARGRGAALYLPEGTVPMLPWETIERLGLGLAEVSPALSFRLDLTSQGQVAGLEIVPSWVRVTRLTYEEADSRLEDEPLRSLYHLARRFQSRRQEQGALSLDLPEVRIQVNGDEVTIRSLLPLRSRDLVTEAMLMAGVAVARFALEHDIPLPFTTQDPPTTDERPQAGDLAAMFAMRRSLRPSEYSTVAGPHAGLGLDVYAQATSPLRRYLDLVVHQQLRAHVRGEALLDSQEVLERVGATAAVWGQVRSAERQSRQHWTMVYLAKHPDWTGDGVLVDRRDSRSLVLLPDLDLDTWVHLRRDLPLNSRVELALRKVNLPELRAHFQVVKPISNLSPPRQTKASRIP